MTDVSIITQLTPLESESWAQIQGSCHEPAVTLQVFKLRLYLQECFTPETRFHVGKILPTPTDNNNVEIHLIFPVSTDGDDS